MRETQQAGVVEGYVRGLIHTFVPDIVVRGLRKTGRVAEVVCSCKASTCTWPRYSLARGAPVTHSAGEGEAHTVHG